MMDNLVFRGESVDSASYAMIMIHGRGATAESILDLADVINEPNIAYLAPQAPGYTWYPQRFIAPMDDNQPGIDNGLATIASIIEYLEKLKYRAERIFLCGFSQGACLALEFVVRNARKYAGVFGLSGGLIGPPGTQWNYGGTFADTDVLLGCSDPDFHIPKERVIKSAEVFEHMGADVTMRLYRDMGHTINRDEINFIKTTIQKVQSQ